MILEIDYSEINNLGDFIGFIVSSISDLLQVIFNSIIFIVNMLDNLVTILPDRIEMIASPFVVILLIIMIYKAWKG